MRAKGVILILMCALFSNTSCNNNKKVGNRAYNLMLKTLLTRDVEEVDVEEASKLNDVVYLDAREKEEYDVSHIKDAIWVGYKDYDSSRVSNIPKDKKIIVYCSVGKRSEDITRKMMQSGYTDIDNLYGGIFEWINRGKKVYNDSGLTTKIHAYNKTWGVWVRKGEKVYNANNT
ncbi:MAG: rhodanese-like domain-containing protein [Chitinophagaceae bacterium]|nr:rhodanese-like domain-containing protein [Chitinophagaceae bacterium]